MNDGYTRVTAPAGFDGQATRRDYYFKARNAAREFRLRIKRWKAEQKSPTDTLSFDDSDKRWLAYLRAHVGNLELLPAIVTQSSRPPLREPVCGLISPKTSALNKPRYFGTSSTTNRYCTPLFSNATTFARSGLMTGVDVSSCVDW